MDDKGLGSAIMTIAIFIGICAIVFLSVCFGFYIITPRGNITGVMTGWSTRDFGDFCGEYPITDISFLDNYTIDGALISDYWDGVFHFFGYHPELIDFDCDGNNGTMVRVCYHQENRSADSDASETVYYWVIDSIEEV